MRTYPNNSSQAAARIVAVAMFADGNSCKAELEVLDRMDALQHLCLNREEFQRVVQDFCEDLLSAGKLTWADACQLDPQTLVELMAEIDDPDVCIRVLSLCFSVVEADGYVCESESLVMTAATTQWGLIINELRSAV